MPDEELDEQTEDVEDTDEQTDEEVDETEESFNELEGDETDGDPEPEAEPLEAPKVWPQEHQELFAQADRKMQEFFLKRHEDTESDYTQKTQEIAPFRRAVEPWAVYLQQIGATPELMLQHLMPYQQAMQTGNPAMQRQALLGLAQFYGIDLAEPETVDDDTFGVKAQIQAAVAPLAAQIQNIGGGFQQSMTLQQQAAENALMQQLSEFRDAKGEDGRLSHPHFDELIEDMRAMAQADAMVGRQSDIANLYERCSWANESVRAKVQAAADAKKRKTDQRRATKTRRAASSLGGSAGGGKKDQPKDLQGDVNAAWDELTAAG